MSCDKIDFSTIDFVEHYNNDADKWQMNNLYKVSQCRSSADRSPLPMDSCLVYESLPQRSLD